MKAILLQAVALSALAAIASAQVPAGPEFRIDSYTTVSPLTPRAGIEPDGDFVVVWMSRRDGSGEGIFSQRFAASGAPRGTEFQINTYTTGRQQVPAVAVGRKGDFVVAWHAPQDLSGYGIQGRRFDASGAPIGGEFLVNTVTTGDQTNPRVGRASDGRFVVTWVSPDGSASGIAGLRFDASGVPIGSEFALNTYTTGAQWNHDLAVDANGDFVAVWEDSFNRDGSNAAIFGQRFDSSGIRLGSDFQVNVYITGRQTTPSVSVSPAGGFVVVWSSNGDGDLYGVFGRRFDTSGTALGTDFIVNTFTTGGQGSGQVAHDSGGNFVVTWWGSGTGDANGSFAQRFTASGARRGAEFRVNTSVAGNQLSPSVASDPAGNFVVAWTSAYPVGISTGIFGQRFGGLAPAALVVDTLGNHALEPGETVDVRPSWRNFNGAAQTFGGTLTNITGPAGAIYTITDATGDYGTVADGATAPCADCYAVSLSNPAPRPAVHWDASAVESILPDTHGQQKRWVLHVGASFSDVPTTSPFYRFIETLLHHSVTVGCGAGFYCPTFSTTREQMAVFVLRAKEGSGYVPPACTTPLFADVPATSPFCRWIEELANRGVVTGCGGGNYCPTANVSREQMAVFVLRTLDPALVPPDCVPPNLFNDVPETSGFCRWVEELANRGVVTGCGGGNYCPTAPVTREQMGVFISMTFGLTLYGP